MLLIDKEPEPLWHGLNGEEFQAKLAERSKVIIWIQDTKKVAKLATFLVSYVPILVKPTNIIEVPDDEATWLLGYAVCHLESSGIG